MSQACLQGVARFKVWTQSSLLPAARPHASKKNGKASLLFVTWSSRADRADVSRGILLMSRLECRRSLRNRALQRDTLLGISIPNYKERHS